MNDEIHENLTWLELENRSLSALAERFPQEWASIKHEMRNKARLNFFNEYLIQKLLFSSDGSRKPVSLSWFYSLWPIVWQRKLLMRSVELKGIYCFYSKELINALAIIIGSKSCLEIAAGDGTLTRFLKAQGIQITATDNQSWSHSIEYPDTVFQCDAEAALQQYNPEIVICSWPPRDNDFERHIFETDSVQIYILIASRLEKASGNWKDYEKQSTFSFKEDKKLSKLMLPPELESAVYLFHRKLSTRKS